MEKEYDIQDVINAGYTLEPIKCRFCGQLGEVTFNQQIGDGLCGYCGKWQLSDNKKEPGAGTSTVITVKGEANITCTTGIDGDEQMSTFMNASQSVLGSLSISIAVSPDIPAEVIGKGQKEVAQWLVEKMSVLGPAFGVEIQIGDDEPEAKD